MRLTLTLLCIATFWALCNGVNPIRNLFGPKFVSPVDFPLMVSIKSRFFGVYYKHTCGGGLINDQWIVSCGSCLQPYELNFHLLRVSVGNQFTFCDWKRQESRVISVVISKDQDAEHSKNRLALIKTKIRFTLHDTVKPLPFGAFVDSHLLTGYVPSWGNLNNKFMQYFWTVIPFYTGSLWLKAYEMELHECKRNTLTPALKRTLKIDNYDDKICAHSVNTQVPCLGDEGSPLIVSGCFVGVYIAPVTCGMSKKAQQVFLRLYDFKEFIERTAEVELDFNTVQPSPHRADSTLPMQTYQYIPVVATSPPPFNPISTPHPGHLQPNAGFQQTPFRGNSPQPQSPPQPQPQPEPEPDSEPEREPQRHSRSQSIRPLRRSEVPLQRLSRSRTLSTYSPRRRPDSIRRQVPPQYRPSPLGPVSQESRPLPPLPTEHDQSSQAQLPPYSLRENSLAPSYRTFDNSRE